MTSTISSPISIPYLPTQNELPTEDNIPMETQRHKTQMELLIETFYVWLEDQDRGYASGNMLIYFSLDQLKNRDFRRPDFFAVLDVPKGERKSWVVWEEGKAPDVVIELLSESTSEADKTEKKNIYQNQLWVPEYYWFDPFNIEDFAGFSLQNGLYQPIIPNENKSFISQRLGLALVYWQGVYSTINTTWIRWATLEREIVPTYAEKAQQEAQCAIAQLKQAAKKLLQQGMTITQVAQITGLSETELQAMENS
ncbi:protein of unknown function DUF820 [Rippkaea orientalis PCC 8801]|uniref:Putative restriction endonuclease domain-containing protein n=1 Tax=Rippkaea orientalis (strain PCC 8801 / RF-1) TaxID=41431 RepID=B7K1Q8_RIPO1|nr:Uma2 family endonuclease [Rippkaea orientalis]ACK67600.1 protein of unknown function DUF820 [Rippkaea orientalis PCC 8801]